MQSNHQHQHQQFYRYPLEHLLKTFALSHLQASLEGSEEENDKDVQVHINVNTILVSSLEAR